MTNTHKIIDVLRESDKPLSTSEVAERIDSSVQSVSSALNRMEGRKEVFRDESHEGGYSVMWQLRKQ